MNRSPLPLLALTLACGGAAYGCAAGADSAPVPREAQRRAATLYPRLYPGVPRPDSAAPVPEAEPVLGPQSGLEEYLRYGLAHNPGLRAAFDRWRAAVQRVPQVTALPDPMLNFTHFVEEVQTRTGPQRNRLILSQALPWFGKLRLQGEVAARAAQSAWHAVEARRLSLIREIKRTFYEYGYLARAVRIGEDNLQLLHRLEPVVQRRVAAGGKQDDVVRLQVEIGKVENELETLRKLRPTLSSRLDAALNRQESELLPWPQLAEPELVTATPEQLLERVRAANPELAALRQDLRRAEEGRSLAELSGYPDFVVGLTWLETGDAASATPGSGDDPLGVTVGMNLPIFGSRYSAQAREALRLQEAASASLNDRLNTLRADLQLAWFKLDDGARQITLFRDTLLPRARQSFTLTETSYRGGTATLLEVIDSQRILLAFENSYWRGASNYGQSLADLEAICGGEIR